MYVDTRLKCWYSDSVTNYDPVLVLIDQSEPSVSILSMISFYKVATTHPVRFLFPSLYIKHKSNKPPAFKASRKVEIENVHLLNLESSRV